MAKKVTIFGITISLTFLGIAALFFLIKSLDNLFKPFFNKYNVHIFIFSLIIVLILIFYGSIKFRELKDIFG